MPNTMPLTATAGPTTTETQFATPRTSASPPARRLFAKAFAPIATAPITMRPVLFLITLAARLALASTPVAAADELYDHPAIAARRVIAAQGYDSTAKFYPHPAWLYLMPEEPARQEPALAGATNVRPPAAVALRLAPQPSARRVVKAHRASL